MLLFIVRDFELAILYKILFVLLITYLYFFCRVRETILNSIYVHKPYWRCYNYQPTYRCRQSIPNVCDDEKQKHTVSVKWEGDETRPDRYATRDCYPLQDNEVKRKISEKLDHLRIGKVTYFKNKLVIIGLE